MRRHLDYQGFLDEVEDRLYEFEEPVAYAPDRYFVRAKRGGKARAKKKAAKKRRGAKTFKIDRKTEKKATDVLRLKTVRKLLCPVLVTLSADAFEIAKVTTPILLSLSLAHTITLPLSATVYASIAVVISRVGAASLCKDYNTSNK